MITEIEKTFFDTFGIEPETGVGLVKFKQPHYPQITDRMLLKLEDIIHSEYNILVYEKFMYSIRITAYPMRDDLPCDPAYFTVAAQAANKREALLALAMDINVQPYIKQQVQALFEEEK